MTANTEEVQQCCGLDLGRLQDPSAFAWFERRRPKIPESSITYQTVPGYGETTVSPPVRLPFTGTLTKQENRQRLWRYELVKMKVWDGRPYDEVVQWLVKLYSRPPVYDTAGNFDDRRGGLAGTTLAVDYTGVGVPLVEWLAKEMKLQGARAAVRPVWITAGHKVNEREDVVGYNVPKIDLVSVLQMLMGTGRLTIRRAIENCNGLLREFENFKVKQSPETGHLSFSAWRESDHDDKVLAAATGLWVAEKAAAEFWVR